VHANADIAAVQITNIKWKTLAVSPDFDSEGVRRF